MMYIKGKFKGEETRTSKTGYVARNLFIAEEGRMIPSMVSVGKEFVAPKVDSDIEIPIRCSAWDEKSRKFTSHSVRYYAVSPISKS